MCVHAGQPIPAQKIRLSSESWIEARPGGKGEVKICTGHFSNSFWFEYCITYGHTKKTNAYANTQLKICEHIFYIFNNILLSQQSFNFCSAASMGQTLRPCLFCSFRVLLIGLDGCAPDRTGSLFFSLFSCDLSTVHLSISPSQHSNCHMRQ